MKKHFKVNRICSTEDYEISIKVHRTLYSDKWDKLYEEISTCTAYTSIFGIKKVLKNRRHFIKAKNEGYIIHFE